MNKEETKKYMSEYYSKNKEKLNQQSKEYYKKHKERLLILQKGWARKRLYNLSQEEYSFLLETQESKCAICFKSFTKTPHIDHDHTTGIVRGLLCGSCNSGLGFYEKYGKEYKRYLNEN